MVDASTVRTWVSQAVAGDVLALQKLLVVHHGRLRAHAGQRLPPALRTKVEPEDLLQQVYTEAARCISDFHDSGPDSFYRWLKRILDSKMIDAYRFYHAGARNIASEVPENAAGSQIASLVARAALDTLTPSRILVRREATALVLAALVALPEDYRRVLELRFMQGLALAQVATAMNRSMAAVQMLSGRALRRLRDGLRDLSRIPL
jgi:RNA polymerase sigma-70 factor (ECF subfamily)